MEVEKTLEMNKLFDFYGPLLTKKQQEYMSLYYRDDYSLGEIAEEFDISRQAVYDNIKRSEASLKNYEETLHLVKNFDQREKAAKKIEKYVKDTYGEDEQLKRLVQSLTQENNDN